MVEKLNKEDKEFKEILLEEEMIEIKDYCPYYLEHILFTENLKTKK